MRRVCLSPLDSWILWLIAGVPTETSMFSSVKVNPSLACWQEQNHDCRKSRKICTRFLVVHRWAHTWFAGICTGVSIPGSETLTDFRFMFTTLNWVSEDDGKFGKVFWNKQNDNIHLTQNLLSWAVFTLAAVANAFTHINFQLYQSSTNKCYCCQDHANGYPF